MAPILPHPGSRRPAGSDELLFRVEQAIRFGAEAYGQLWSITSRSWMQELNRFFQGARTSATPEVIMRGMVRGYVNWLSELTTLAPSVAEKAAMEFSRRSDARLEPDSGAAPSAEGEIFEVAGKPIAMPARVLDASQGWAMFFVDIAAANRALGAAGDSLSAFDAGGGRTPLTILGVDYRASDFGAYPEFVVALTVTAKDDPAMQLFSYCLAIVVTQPFTQEAARIVWGLEKIVAPRLTVVYAADKVQFGLSDRSGKALSIRFPRFGDGESSDQPTFSVSRRGPDQQIYWAMTTRSGSGEGIQIGGSVVLELGVPGDGKCLCGDGKSACLCETLRAFDISDSLPAANGWTERQSAVFGGPRLLDLS